MAAIYRVLWTASWNATHVIAVQRGTTARMQLEQVLSLSVGDISRAWLKVLLWLLAVGPGRDGLAVRSEAASF